MTILKRFTLINKNNRMRQLSILIGLAFIIITSACSPMFYSINSQNVPLLEAKGDGCLTVSGNTDIVGFQAAYGINDNVGLQLNGGIFIPKELDSGNRSSGKFIEGGLGYFKSFDNALTFETYGLFGIGSVENHLPATITVITAPGELSGNILRYGIQPSLGYESNRFEAVISSRIVRLNYSTVEGFVNFEDAGQVDYFSADKSKFLIEPALTLRGGLDKIKVQVQIGYSLNMGKILDEKRYKHDKKFATVGLHYSLN